MPPDLLSDCQAVRRAAWLLFRWLMALTAVDAQSPPPRPSPSPSVHKPLQHLPLGSPKEPERCHETWLLEARLRVRACSPSTLVWLGRNCYRLLCNCLFPFPCSSSERSPCPHGAEGLGVQWACSPEVHWPKSARPQSLPEFQDHRQGAWLG